MATSRFFSRDTAVWAVALLLMGVTPCYGGCAEKVAECTAIVTNLSTAILQGGGISTLCTSAVQSMTTCVNAAKTECTGQTQTLAALQASLDSVEKSMCGSCFAKTLSCIKPILNLVTSSTNITMATVIGLCGYATTMASCMNGLEASCTQAQGVPEMSHAVNQMNSYCGLLTNKGQCPTAILCLNAVIPAQGQSSPTSCSMMTTLLGCLKSKAEEAKCTVDQSKVTFTKLQEILTDICPVENLKCSAAYQCMGNLSLPNTPSFSGSDGQSSSQTFDLANPGIYCRLLSIAAKCYIDNKDKCKYDATAIAKIEVKYKSIAGQCPSSAIRGTVPGVLCCLMLLLSLFMSFWPRQ